MQHQTVPQTTPELAFAGFAPGENRELLADVHRWARTNGWTWHECWGWVNAPYASEADLAVEWDNERPGVLTIRTGPVVFRPKHYDVDSVRQAVDQLVTLGILPDRFATSYRLGVAAGLDSATEQESTTDVARTSEPDLRQRLAGELRRIADDLVTQQLPIYDLLSARLYLGVLDSRADLQRWADYLGTEIAEGGGTDDNIPHVEHQIMFGDKSWGPTLSIHAQISPEPETAGGAR